MPRRFDPTQRFDGRVAAYRASRPSYPTQLYDRLLAEVAPPGARIADLGSGTGIFSAELVYRGYQVFGVEPNAAMRERANLALAARPEFVSVDGRAESTSLPDHAVDLVVSAQAFHWFDFDRTRKEVERILEPPGAVAWVWNSRRVSGSRFAEAYERFLEEWGVDYVQVRETYRVRERLGSFFPQRRLEYAAFDNHQTLNETDFRARVLSASYMPAPDDLGYAPMLEALESLFARHSSEGAVRLDFDSELFWTA